MRYLFGDSTESGLEFNYLNFLRDVMDCAVALVECEASMATSEDRKKAKEKDANAIIASIEELGKRTAHLVSPFVKEREETPVGRCAAAIAVAAKEAMERESKEVRAALATGLAAIEGENGRLRKKSSEIFDKLLKNHDLPNAEKVYEVAWTSNGLKAAMRQRTAFGIEAVWGLEVPAASLFTADLRVDKVADGVEINALEPGGWLKKGDKLVPHKLGRYHITRVVVGADVTVRVRSASEPTAPAFEITTTSSGDIKINHLGGSTTAREFSIEDAAQPKLRQLTDKVAEAAKALGEHRSAVSVVEIDGIVLADHPHPRAVAERLVHAIAPTVVKIMRHSRSPGELVLRRMLSDDRREEIFVSTTELLKKLDPLPPGARDVFAPLQLEGPPEEREAVPQYAPPSGSSASRKGTMPPPSPMQPPPPPRRSLPPLSQPTPATAMPIAALPGITLPRTNTSEIAETDVEEVGISSIGVPLDALASAADSSDDMAAAPDEDQLDEQLDDDNEPVALDVMKATPIEGELEDEGIARRKKNDSLGSAIDAALGESDDERDDATS